MKKNSKKKTKYVEKIDAALKAKDERAEKAARRELKEMMLKNKQLIKARQAAEWGMRSLQGSFGRLKFPLDALNLERWSRSSSSRAPLLQIAPK